MHLSQSRGYICVVCDTLTSKAHETPISVRKQDGYFHITLITKDELSQISQSQRDTILAQAVHSSDIIDLGVGRNAQGTVFFNVIVWSKGNEIRRSVDLPTKDFHMTLSETDDHNLCKDLTAIPESVLCNGLTERDFDTAFLYYVQNHRNDAADRLASRYRTLYPTHSIAHIRYADTLSRAGQHKHALLAYAHAAGRLSDSSKMYEYAIRRICKTARFTEFTPAYTEFEISQAETAVADGFLEYLHAFTPAVQRDVRERFAEEMELDLPFAMPSREKMYLCAREQQTMQTHRLPRFFRWLVPHKLAVMSTPRNEVDIDNLLTFCKITLVVTLTQETPLPKEWFAGKRVSNLFMPIANYHAPTLAQVDHFIKRVLDLPDCEAALVHCGGGKGRAGTFAACYLAKCGFTNAALPNPTRSSDEIIRLLRHMRPGSIETAEQERFVSSYVSHIWKSIASHDTTILEPTDHALHINGPFPQSTRTIILCGLPGSGKSTFATRLCERGEFMLISQDDIGKDASLNALGTAAKTKTRFVLDRCNATIAARKDILKMAFEPTDALCVYFDYDSALCIQRADSRNDHPTVRQGNATRIVEAFQRQFTAPTRDEGFACIVTVRSFLAAETLLSRLGTDAVPRFIPSAKSPVPPIAKSIRIHKFPRTRHLLNLGAATRDDLVLSHADVAGFLNTADGSNLAFEEKVDGANLGISIDAGDFTFKVQNRSHYVSSKSHAQFKKLDKWLEDHSPDLRSVLIPGHTILFGEWLYATHSIPYQCLPDTFLIFDLYDVPNDRFFSRASLAEKLAPTSLQQVPPIDIPTSSSSGIINTAMLKAVATTTQSKFYDGIIEGVYIRRERDGWLIDRAKIVRNDFIAGNEHWNRGGVQPNGIIPRMLEPE
ncbi:hypothetical protein PhCBS80983_g03979 [Powellomyces hirtus]|uniref:Tyrosine specific protein phosphatases domain-containing protein n=1 Tax=Powellomyces hirtus TaxID=109895 RepID=A0A507E0E4_9FUNG|nr:hypothetical protein PhCBS80983_g03979 [Powellomyces hirtus]